MTHSAEFLAIVEAAKPHVREVTLAELANERDYQLIDVREDREWNDGHMVDAKHIGRGVLERDAIAQLPNKSAPLVLYCGGGFRSILGAESLQKMGYTNVRSLAGGWKAVLAAGLPTTKG